MVKQVAFWFFNQSVKKFVQTSFLLMLLFRLKAPFTQQQQQQQHATRSNSMLVRFMLKKLSSISEQLLKHESGTRKGQEMLLYIEKG